MMDFPGISTFVKTGIFREKMVILITLLAPKTQLITVATLLRQVFYEELALLRSVTMLRASYCDNSAAAEKLCLKH